MNFTLPVNPVNSLNIPKQPPALQSAQSGLHDPHVLKTNITRAKLLPREQSVPVKTPAEKSQR